MFNLTKRSLKPFFFFSITTMAWHSCRCVSPSRRRVHSTFLAPKQKKIFHKRKSNKSCLAKCWRILYTENNKRPNCHRRIPQIFVVCHCVIAPWTSISICNKKKGYTYKFSLFSRYSRTHTHTHTFHVTSVFYQIHNLLLYKLYQISWHIEVAHFVLYAT